MAYLKIPNLYKDQRILDFPEIYAIEKLHGTSAHIKFTMTKEEQEKIVDENGPLGTLTFFSGGERYENFVNLFDRTFLQKTLNSFLANEIILYGEAYGGKQQGMKDTYGPDLKFCVFDVKLNGVWLTVPNAEILTKFCKLEFVHYVKIKTSLEAIDKERDKDSVQAIRNGVGPGKKMEGIVLRPLEEFVDEKGNRIIAKHKRENFQETKTPREVSQEELKVLADAKAIANEWVTPMRLQHILDKAQAAVNIANTLPGVDTQELNESDTGNIIKMMLDDIEREAKGEIVESKEARTAIGRKTATMYKEWLKNRLKDKTNASL